MTNKMEKSEWVMGMSQMIIKNTFDSFFYREWLNYKKKFFSFHCFRFIWAGPVIVISIL